MKKLKNCLIKGVKSLKKIDSNLIDEIITMNTEEKVNIEITLTELDHVTNMVSLNYNHLINRLNNNEIHMDKIKQLEKGLDVLNGLYEKLNNAF